ncbi:MAG: orotidine 5'-phosphate decarboxylase / HUMPS family protein [Candidatus Riflebacteria bacterium]
MSKKEFRFIPALDVLDLETVEKIAEKTGKSNLVYGYKLGFSLGLTYGLGRVVDLIRRHSEKPIIYDHQKAATDIPDTGALFARTMKNAGINEAILFPQAGPETLKAWIEALQNESLKVIVGGLMTHKAYVVSEGGFLEDKGIETIYRTAVEKAVSAFVVPLTKPDAVEKLVAAVNFPPQSEFYSPGFGSQGGDAGRFPGISRHYLIVGRALLSAADPMAWLEKAAAEIRS